MHDFNIENMMLVIQHQEQAQQKTSSIGCSTISSSTDGDESVDEGEQNGRIDETLPSRNSSVAAASGKNSKVEQFDLLRSVIQEKKKENPRRPPQLFSVLTSLFQVDKDLPHEESDDLNFINHLHQNYCETIELIQEHEIELSLGGGDGKNRREKLTRQKSNSSMDSFFDDLPGVPLLLNL